MVGCAAGEWVPYIASDVQLEVIQLETKLRLELKPNELGVYEVTARRQLGTLTEREGYRLSLQYPTKRAFTSSESITCGEGACPVLCILPADTGRCCSYSAIEVVQQLTVRPFRHDEFERFVVAAFPYYVSSFAMMAGGLLWQGMSH